MNRIDTDTRRVVVLTLAGAYVALAAATFKRQQERDELLNDLSFRTSQIARQTSPDHDGDDA